ncbi:MAG: hypothetical protein LLG37_11015, partial [Spirochaetia bacterium]|nr:hypothetical protein [Spirochaetia bacterium]
MRRQALFVMSFLLLSMMAIPAMAAEAENLIIPQKNPIYSDLAAYAEAGYITTTAADYFRANAITKYEAAIYIKEALSKPELAGDKQAAKKMAAYAKEYSAQLKALETAELYAKPGSTPVPDGFEKAAARIDEIAEEMAKNSFTDSSVFKIEGNLMAKWQDYDMFGVTNQHYGAFSGTRMELDVNGSPISGLNYSLIMSFEVPTTDPAYGTQNNSFFGAANLMDTYLLGLSMFGWSVNAGIFWEDITTFIASQGASLRPSIFERDKYAGDVRTRDYFETVFRNYFQTLDDRWSKHPWMGVEAINSKIFGRGTLKVMAGKAENFNAGGNTNYLYEFAARYTHKQDIPFLTGAEWSVNAYNTSNDKSEMYGLDEVSPYKYIKSCTVAGGDLKANLFKLFKLQTEFEWSHNDSKYVGTLATTPYTTQGSAF